MRLLHGTRRWHPIVLSAAALLMTTSCTDRRPSPATAAGPTAAPCRSTDLHGVFRGGGMGTGNDIGAVVIWNSSRAACRLAGRASLTASDQSGRPDPGARAADGLPDVAVTLPGNPTADLSVSTGGHLDAALIGSERDDPAQPDGLCSPQDRLAPATLVITVGGIAVPAVNRDPGAGLVKAMTGCNGKILLEEFTLG